VIVDPEEIRMIVFNKGISYGLNRVIPLEGRGVIIGQFQ